MSDPGSIRDPGSGPGSGIRDPGSGIRDPGFCIRDPGSGIRDPGSGILDPYSTHAHTHSATLSDADCGETYGYSRRMRDGALSNNSCGDACHIPMHILRLVETDIVAAYADTDTRLRSPPG